MPSIALGFRLAGATNILGVLLFSLALTNARLTAHSPVVFSRFGLVCIILWGFAYLSVAEGHERVPYLVAVFAVEKLLYVATWVNWIRRFSDQLPRMFAESPLTGAFYAVYGPLDLLFCVFFTVVAIRCLRARTAATA